jgi:6-phosphogluconolactonase/glucosamine-6-phosphate isomerase/deaminase
VAAKLAGEDLQQLTVSLTDERPGPLGHPDSNWLGLMDAGFQLRGAHLQPVLNGDDTLSETAAFNRFLHEQLERNDYKLGVFGIGPDGHTAGLPAQNAAASEKLADYYQAGSFQRISSTPAAIARLDEIVAFAVGESKHLQLERLAQNAPYAEQSAQALKPVASLTVFNDFMGESPS